MGSAADANPNTTPPDHRRFPTSAGILLGLGLGGFFDGIVFHQLLQWHHMVSNTGYPPDTIENMRINVFADGVFHAATCIFIVTGILVLWRRARQPHFFWSRRKLAGSLLIGFGAFTLVEGVNNHHLLGIHHVNETVPRDQWFWWDLAFLAWGAIMLVIGLLMLRNGRDAFMGSLGIHPKA